MDVKEFVQGRTELRFEAETCLLPQRECPVLCGEGIESSLPPWRGRHLSLGKGESVQPPEDSMGQMTWENETWWVKREESG